MTNPTPAPWLIYEDANPLRIGIKGIDPQIGGAHVATVLGRDNAALILKAVNNHDALVTHLERLAIHCCDNEALELVYRLRDAAVAITSGVREGK